MSQLISTTCPTCLPFSLILENILCSLIFQLLLSITLIIVIIITIIKTTTSIFIALVNNKKQKMPLCSSSHGSQTDPTVHFYRLVGIMQNHQMSWINLPRGLCTNNESFLSLWPSAETFTRFALPALQLDLPVSACPHYPPLKPHFFKAGWSHHLDRRG